MNISLSEQVEKYIAEQVKAGAFASPNDVIENALKTQQLLQSARANSEQQQRRKVAIRLHEIEGNPFTPADEEMFTMFDRKGWSFEQRADYIKQQALNAATAR